MNEEDPERDRATQEEEEEEEEVKEEEGFGGELKRRVRVTVVGGVSVFARGWQAR